MRCSHVDPYILTGLNFSSFFIGSLLTHRELIWQLLILLVGIHRCVYCSWQITQDHDLPSWDVLAYQGGYQLIDCQSISSGDAPVFEIVRIGFDTGLITLGCVSTDAEIFKFYNYLSNKMRLFSSILLRRQLSFFTHIFTLSFFIQIFTFSSLLPIIQQCACIVVNFNFKFLISFFCCCCKRSFQSLFSYLFAIRPICIAIQWSFNVNLLLFCLKIQTVLCTNTTKRIMIRIDICVQMLMSRLFCQAKIEPNALIYAVYH